MVSPDAILAGNSAPRKKRKKKPTARSVYRKLATTDTGLGVLSPKERALWAKRSSPQGVHRVARRRASKLWDEVTPITGLQGEAPKMRFTDKPIEDHAAWVNDKGTIVMPMETTAMLGAIQNRAVSDQARRIMLHEFAHTQQPDRYVPARDEGRAERFQQFAGNMLGLEAEYEPGSTEYARWARISKKRDSRNKILLAQFLRQGQR